MSFFSSHWKQKGTRDGITEKQQIGFLSLPHTYTCTRPNIHINNTNNVDFTQAEPDSTVLTQI